MSSKELLIIALKLIKGYHWAPMGLLNFKVRTFLRSLNFDLFSDYFKFAPLIVNQVFRLLFVEFFPPDVRSVDIGISEAPN